MQALFRKYLDNQCSEDEVKLLLAYFKVSDNEPLLRQLITESLEAEEDSDDDSQWLQVTDSAFEAIKSQLKEHKVKKTAVVHSLWFRMAAAAIVVAGIITTLQFANNRNTQEDSKQAVEAFTRTEPGNKAQLILANGSVIQLDGVSKGMLRHEGTTRIMQPAHGQIVYEGGREKPGKVLYNSIATPRGGQYQVILSDGSKIWLNAASSLKYPVAFTGNERKVELTGEAYFEVSGDPSMPFRVNIAGKGEVEVVGTRFNVNAYQDEKTVYTTLLEGKVKVKAFKSGMSLMLKPGDQSQLDVDGQLTITRNADSTHAIAWKQGSFNFYNADLRFVFRQLSRWYDVDIVYEGPIPYREFTGEIPRDAQLTHVLKLLERNNVPTRLEGTTLVILQ